MRELIEWTDEALGSEISVPCDFSALYSLKECVIGCIGSLLTTTTRVTAQDEASEATRTDRVLAGNKLSLLSIMHRTAQRDATTTSNVVGHDDVGHDI